MSDKNQLLLAFYGDDFTGSTDALEFMSLAGAKTVLFIAPPTQAQLNRYEGLQAIGVAGMTRSMAPTAMEETLRPAFAALKDLKPAHIHYKVCSTFDSSATVGSIGKVADIGADLFEAKFIPCLVAAPALGRYSAFGNLFARMGIGSKGKIHRLDRHPSMSKHPVTPADESDLLLHLSKQTSKRMGLFDMLQLELEPKEARKALEEIINEGAEIVFIDAMYKHQMAGIGRLMDGFAKPEEPFFSIGSSGIEMALGNYWKEAGILVPRTEWPNLGAANPLLVISGSCSPVTSGQIASAIAQGFEEIPLDTLVFFEEAGAQKIQEDVIENAVALLQTGKSVIIHTCKGAADERVAQAKQKLSLKGIDKAGSGSQTSVILGTALGEMARGICDKITLKRIVVAGGDTSSFAARAMGIEAVEMIAPLSPGAPLCRAFAPGSSIDGLEVNFKGGQVGAEDYFLRASGVVTSE